MSKLDRNPWPPFIPKAFDDAGLPPNEFRIACRIGRRGECFETLGEIARGCRLHRDTVISVLGRLVKWSVVSKSKRTGTTSVFTLNPPEEWRLPIGTQGATLGEDKGQVDIMESEGQHLPESKGRKGNPLKARGVESTTGVTFRHDGEAEETFTIPTY